MAAKAIHPVLPTCIVHKVVQHSKLLDSGANDFLRKGRVCYVSRHSKSCAASPLDLSCNL